MAKYARVKEDGFIMNHGIHMDAQKFDFFEYSGEEPIPEYIQDLPAFIAGNISGEVTAKPKKKKEEPVFLKNEAGDLVS